MPHAPLIGTVVVSYKRPELLRQTLSSYLETVDVPFRLLAVDNGGSQEALDVLAEFEVETVEMGENRFPGYATNVGWDILAPSGCSYLHRSDNDVRYLPGWVEEVKARFGADPNLGQLGLRTLEEEGPQSNVGGNCVVRPDVFEKVRWQNEPWQRGGVDTEDYVFSRAVLAAGFQFGRALTPCIIHLGTGTPDDDPYYAESWHAKGYGGY